MTMIPLVSRATDLFSKYVTRYVDAKRIVCLTPMEDGSGEIKVAIDNGSDNPLVLMTKDTMLGILSKIKSAK